MPSVISSGTFLAQKHYTKTNIAIAVHFITLGGVLMFATTIFYFTLNQLAKAIEEYTVPSELTLVHVGLSPTADLPGGQTFTLSPLTESDKIDHDLWDSGLSKVRRRLISIRNAGAIMLCFYVVVYMIYGIARPLIHANVVWNVIFCAVFNLDPGTPTIYAYFIVSIIYHINTGPPRLRNVYSVPRPPLVHMPSSRPNRPIDDSYLFELHRSSRVLSDFSHWSPRKGSPTLSNDLGSLYRGDSFEEKDSGLGDDHGLGHNSNLTVVESGSSSS
ncbi:hypothetical protein BGZ98_003926 [Dissophora globulifera]|nr:hypothetical protein BGZ98_003926 [Dissophora globulifera]